MFRFIPIALLAAALALGGCAAQLAAWQGAAARPVQSCADWPSMAIMYRAKAAGLPPEYAAAACARGWSWAEVRVRASSRGYALGACRGSSASSRRLLYEPCGDLKGHPDARGRRP